MKVAIETETYGMDLNRDGDGFSGSANYGIDTGEPQLNIKYKKKNCGWRYVSTTQ